MRLGDIPGSGSGFSLALSSSFVASANWGGGVPLIICFLFFILHYFRIGPLPLLENCTFVSGTYLSTKCQALCWCWGHRDEGDTGPPSEADSSKGSWHAWLDRSWWEQEGPGCSGDSQKALSGGSIQVMVGRVGGGRTEALEEGHGSSLRPETYQDPVTRFRQILCLHCGLTSVESSSAHSPNKNSNRGPLMFKCQTLSVPK